MVEGLRRHRFLHTASDIFFYCDNPTVLFAIRSQSTSPSEEVEALVRVWQDGRTKALPYGYNHIALLSRGGGFIPPRFRKVA